MSKGLNERRADNLERFALVLIGAAFVGRFDFAYRLLLGLAGIATYIVSEWFARRDDGGGDDDQRS